MQLIKKMEINSKLVRADDGTLRKKYPDQYIAIDNGKVIAHSKSAAELKSILEKGNKYTPTVLVQYIPRAGFEVLF